MRVWRNYYRVYPLQDHLHQENFSCDFTESMVVTFLATANYPMDKDGVHCIVKLEDAIEVPE